MNASNITWSIINLSSSSNYYLPPIVGTIVALILTLLGVAEAFETVVFSESPRELLAGIITATILTLLGFAVYGKVPYTVVEHVAYVAIIAYAFEISTAFYVKVAEKRLAENSC